uniref:Uncharacterized protein n=1 Tax=Nelumbo nucifera TaxID=4432 RepID=A0A822ZGD9_NELNU|nr:TPA_asm: hypothetical protein HUJ06_003434 [Nelumbo nucifera]
MVVWLPTGDGLKISYGLRSKNCSGRKSIKQSYFMM